MEEIVIPLEIKTKIKVKIGEKDKLNPITNIYGCDTPRGKQSLDYEQRFFDPR